MTSNCKGCGEELTSIETALSRYGHGDICSNCGTLEALHGDFIKKYDSDVFTFPVDFLKPKFLDAVESLIEQESAILNREMTDFLAKHNLPMDREKILEAGFELITEHIAPKVANGDTKYIFKLCKLVDQHKIKITHNVGILESKTIKNI